MILITGGAGFIGSHLTKRLLREGKKVAVLDNFDSFYNPEIKKKNIKPYLTHPNFTLIEGDIREKKLIKEVFWHYQVEEVVHLAARAGVRGSVKDPFVYEDVNIRGTLTLLDVCKDFGIKSFIFASSSSVYGEIDNIPFSEDDFHFNPLSPYGVTKLAGELLCKIYHKLYKIPITCIRIFTAYGPAQRPEMAIHKFTRLILKEEPVTIFGDGTSKRDYTYIDDLVEGILLALNHKFNFEVINLGSSCPVELLTVVRIIESHLKKKAKIRYLPPQSGDPYLTYANINKAKKILGYNPKVSIEEGIGKFVRWYCENQSWLEKLVTNL